MKGRLLVMIAKIITFDITLIKHNSENTTRTVALAFAL